MDKTTGKHINELKTLNNEQFLHNENVLDLFFLNNDILITCTNEGIYAWNLLGEKQAKARIKLGGNFSLKLKYSSTVPDTFILGPEFPSMDAKKYYICSYMGKAEPGMQHSQLW